MRSIRISHMLKRDNVDNMNYDVHMHFNCFQICFLSANILSVTANLIRDLLDNVLLQSNSFIFNLRPTIKHVTD